MLLIGMPGAHRRAAGIALFTAMVLSLGVVLRPFSVRPGAQFVLENARTLGTVGVCLFGFGAVAVRSRAVRRWAVVSTAAAAVAFVAVQPLPAAADPTFKAYGIDDTSNPRYFYVCRTQADCAGFLGTASIRFSVTAEKTKVRANGVVAPSVSRLEFQSAPGGPPRVIPLLALHPGQRVFSFRSANLSHGRLVAYGAGGRPIAGFRLSPLGTQAV